MGERERFDLECFRQLRSGDVIRVRIDIDRGQVAAFTLQLETYGDMQWRPIVRYDSAHGHPHRDLLDWDGRVIDKYWLSPTLSTKEIVRPAEQDLTDDAVAYRAAYLERRS